MIWALIIKRLLFWSNFVQRQGNVEYHYSLQTLDFRAKSICLNSGLIFYSADSSFMKIILLLFRFLVMIKLLIEWSVEEYCLCQAPGQSHYKIMQYHIFQKVQVTSNKNVHNNIHHFVDTFLCP